MKEYFDALASTTPTPGGGSASALCAALAASLAAMAAGISGKTLQGLDGYVRQAEKLRADALDLERRDREAFEELSAAYSMGAPTEEALLNAAQVPMQVLELCCEVIRLHSELKTAVRPSVLSDVAAGTVLAWGGMYASAVNVRANTRLMTDRERAEQLNRRAEELMGEYWLIADRDYEEIYKVLGEPVPSPEEKQTLSYKEY